MGTIASLIFQDDTVEGMHFALFMVAWTIALLLVAMWPDSGPKTPDKKE